MNCPYCNKLIPAMTGLQELQKFRKHLKTCKKHPDRHMIATSKGDIKERNPEVDMNDALNIRHESGQ